MSQDARAGERVSDERRGRAREMSAATRHLDARKQRRSMNRGGGGGGGGGEQRFSVVAVINLAEIRARL